MVNVLGVAFERRPGAGSSPAHQAFALLEAEGWQPEQANLRLIVAPCRWWGVAEMVADEAAGADAIVLFAGRKAKRRALVARYARNEAKAHAVDSAGLRWPGAELAPTAAAALGVTLCPFRMARAMELAGLPAKVTAGSDRYVYNHSLFRLLARPTAPPTALVRLPVSLESARQDGQRGHVNRMQIVAGVAAALSMAAAAVEAMGPSLRLGPQASLAGQVGSESLPAVYGNP